MVSQTSLWFRVVAQHSFWIVRWWAGQTHLLRNIHDWKQEASKWQLTLFVHAVWNSSGWGAFDNRGANMIMVFSTKVTQRPLANLHWHVCDWHGVFHCSLSVDGYRHWNKLFFRLPCISGVLNLKRPVNTLTNIASRLAAEGNDLFSI